MSSDKFLTNTYKDIKGVTVIDSHIAGKNIGLFAVTHGNEPVGIEIFNYLVDTFKIGEKLKKGKLLLVAINTEAYSRYLVDGDISKHRFIHNNMNRISNKEFKQGSIEFERFKELETIFDEIDIAIDIHSVSKGNEIIGITDKNYLKNAKEFFDVETILVEDGQNTGTLVGYFTRKHKESYGVECGNHISKDGFNNGLKNVLNFLVFQGFIDGTITQEPKNPDILEFKQEIKPQMEGFRYIKDFHGFTEILPNEIFALDGDVELKNNLGDNIYIGIVAKHPKKGDGAGFLFKKLN